MEILQALFRDIDETPEGGPRGHRPHLVLLLITQVTMLRMNRKELRAKLRGFFFATVGLLLFLEGVEVAFIPVGEALGLLGAVKWSPWWLVPIGFALGFLATFAEPAVQLLADEVYNSSARRIPGAWSLDAGHRGGRLRRALGDYPHDFGNPAVAAAGARAPCGPGLDPLLRQGLCRHRIRLGGRGHGAHDGLVHRRAALGVAAAFPDRNPVIDGFGLVAFVLLPILSVLVVGVYRAKEEGLGCRVRES